MDGYWGSSHVITAVSWVCDMIPHSAVSSVMPVLPTEVCVWAVRDEHGVKVCCVILSLRGGQFNMPLTWTQIGPKTKLHRLLRSEIWVGQTHFIKTSHYSGQRLIQSLADLTITKERKPNQDELAQWAFRHLRLKYLCLFQTKSCTNIWKAFFFLSQA